ncbi:hypothetical protein [Mycolicibacterium sediminis]|nr:hypothetical protein [Mycolicibacterium sediminis]
MDLELHSDTSTEDSRGVAANMLALGALASMAIAYLQMFTVLGGTHYASKFENGELPAGVDGSAGELAAGSSIVAAVLALVAIAAALSRRVTKTVGVAAVLVVLAAGPYAILEFITWQLAF